METVYYYSTTVSVSVEDIVKALSNPNSVGEDDEQFFRLDVYECNPETDLSEGACCIFKRNDLTRQEVATNVENFNGEGPKILGRWEIRGDAEKGSIDDIHYTARICFFFKLEHNGKLQRTDWWMKEYILDDDDRHYVVCEIHKTISHYEDWVLQHDTMKRRRNNAGKSFRNLRKIMNRSKWNNVDVGVLHDECIIDIDSILIGKEARNHKRRHQEMSQSGQSPSVVEAEKKEPVGKETEEALDNDDLLDLYGHVPES